MYHTDRIRGVGSWIGAVTLVTLCVAGPASAQESFSLKRTFRAGDVDHYKTVITMEGENPGGPLTFEFVILTTETVKEVKPDGAAVVETKVDSGLLRVKDTERELNDNSVVTTTYDKSGAEMKREAGAASGQRGPAMMMLGLARAAKIPQRTLKVGEVWKYDIPPADAKSPKTGGTVTLIGPEKKSDLVAADSLKLTCQTHVVTPGPMGEDRLEITSTVLIDRESGKPLAVDGTGSGRLGPLTAKRITIKQQHVKSESK